MIFMDSTPFPCQPFKSSKYSKVYKGILHVRYWGKYYFFHDFHWISRISVIFVHWEVAGFITFIKGSTRPEIRIREFHWFSWISLIFMIFMDFECRALQSTKYSKDYKGFLHAPEAWKWWFPMIFFDFQDFLWFSVNWKVAYFVTFIKGFARPRGRGSWFPLIFMNFCDFPAF